MVKKLVINTSLKKIDVIFVLIKYTAIARVIIYGHILNEI